MVTINSDGVEKCQESSVIHRFGRMVSKIHTELCKAGGAAYGHLEKGKFMMTKEERETSVKMLKEALITSPVLRHPDYERIFYIQCDVLDTGV